MDNSDKSVSIIIPAYKPDRKLFVSIERLKKQTVKPTGIYIMLTVSEEYGINELEKELKDNNLYSDMITCVVIEQKDFNHGGTRQQAAEMCCTDYMLFMTQDAVPADRYLIQNLLKGFSTDNTAVCYARQLAGKNAELLEKFSREFNYPAKSAVKTRRDLESGNVRAIFCSDVCAMYDREKFEYLKGFEKKTDFNEDMLYAYKALSADYEVHYASKAQVYHYHNLSIREHFMRNKEIAKSQKAHPEVFKKLSSGKEGMKYVTEGLKYILKNGNIFEAGYFVIYCGVRMLGFTLGKL